MAPFDLGGICALAQGHTHVEEVAVDLCIAIATAYRCTQGEMMALGLDDPLCRDAVIAHTLNAMRLHDSKPSGAHVLTQGCLALLAIAEATGPTAGAAMVALGAPDIVSRGLTRHPSCPELQDPARSLQARLRVPRPVGAGTVAVIVSGGVVAGSAAIARPSSASADVYPCTWTRGERRLCCGEGEEEKN